MFTLPKMPINMPALVASLIALAVIGGALGLVFGWYIPQVMYNDQVAFVYSLNNTSYGLSSSNNGVVKNGTQKFVLQSDKSGPIKLSYRFKIYDPVSKLYLGRADNNTIVFRSLDTWDDDGMTDFYFSNKDSTETPQVGAITGVDLILKTGSGNQVILTENLTFKYTNPPLADGQANLVKLAKM